MIEISEKEAKQILSLGHWLSDKDKDFLSREIYSSRGLGSVLIKSERRLNSIKKKITKKCSRCGNMAYIDSIYSYVDGNNAAITKNSPDICKECLNG